MPDPIRIAISQEIFILQRVGGISRYFAQLARHLASLPDNRTRVLAPVFLNTYLRELPTTIRWGTHLEGSPSVWRYLRPCGRLLGNAALFAFGPQIYHESYYGASPLLPAGCRRIVTVYDMISEIIPEEQAVRRQESEAKRRAVERADHVICISEHTRQDLIRLFSVPAEKATTVHLSHSIDDRPNRPVRPPSPEILALRPFLLFVGIRAGYKNFAGLLRAIGSSPWLSREFQVVCVGGGPFSAQEETLIRDLDLDRTQIHQLSLGDDDLEACYRQAELFVYPSLYEGFGLPPIEAMAYGCPVASSNASCLPEVVGAGGAYFDPRSPEAIRTVLERILHDTGERNRLREQGQAQARRYSWRACAKQTLHIYRKVLAS